MQKVKLFTTTVGTTTAGRHVSDAEAAWEQTVEKMNHWFTGARHSKINILQLVAVPHGKTSVLLVLYTDAEYVGAA